jgi:hypothetical protein
VANNRELTENVQGVDMGDFQALSGESPRGNKEGEKKKKEEHEEDEQNLEAICCKGASGFITFYE